MACARACARRVPPAEPAWQRPVLGGAEPWLPVFFTPGLCTTNPVGAYHCVLPVTDPACRSGEHGTTCGVWQQADPARDPAYAGAVDCVPVGDLFNLCVVPKVARSGPGVFFGERPPGFE